MSDKSKAQFLAIDEIMPIVDMILASQGEVKQWTNVNHVSLVARVAMKAMEKAEELWPDSFSYGESTEVRMFVCKTLDQHGIAGNASQFRQYLQSEKGGKRIAKGSTSEQVYV